MMNQTYKCWVCHKSGFTEDQVFIDQDEDPICGACFLEMLGIIEQGQAAGLLNALKDTKSDMIGKMRVDVRFKDGRSVGFNIPH